MVVRKNANLDLVPAIGMQRSSVIYSLLMVETYEFSTNDILMGFLLGVPQLTLGLFNIGSRTTPSLTIGLLMPRRQFLLHCGFGYSLVKFLL